MVIKRTALALIAVAAVGLALLLQPYASAQPTTTALYTGAVIAKVAGEPIYMQQARYRVSGVETTHDTGKGLASSKSGATPWDEIILQSLADDVIIRQEAASADEHVSIVEVASRTGQTVGAFGGGQPFAEYLGANGLTFDQFVHRVYMQALGAKLYVAVTNDVSVPESKVRAVFNKTRDNYEGNKEIAYETARPAIYDELLKAAKDKAFQAWLEEREGEARYSVNVVDGNWWNELAAETPATTGEEGQ